MSNVPAFFIPFTSPEEQEKKHEILAKFCNRPVQKMEERIYSIQYVHDSAKWTATVGEPLRGIKIKNSRSKGEKVERKHPISDRAIVLAIFSGNPYIVITNARIDPSVVSGWENPFMAGQPKSVTYFSLSK